MEFLLFHYTTTSVDKIFKSNNLGGNLIIFNFQTKSVTDNSGHLEIY